VKRTSYLALTVGRVGLRHAFIVVEFRDDCVDGGVPVRDLLQVRRHDLASGQLS
jgi:hypothetical protein